MMKKILYVDDQKVYRDELSRTVAKLPVSLVLAVDGLDGLSKFRKEKPDLVILDLVLPKLHGLQLCKVIRNTSLAGKNVPVFLVTGNLPADEFQDNLLEKYGAVRFFSKPFYRAELLSAIVRFLEL